jgi:hypothetical protein
LGGGEVIGGKHGPYRDQHGVTDRNQGAFLAPSAGDALVTGGEMGALGAGGTDRNLTRHRLQPGVAMTICSELANRKADPGG